MKIENSNMNCLPLGKKLTIAIDLDGTVADCSAIDFNKVGNDPKELMKAKPIKDALAAIKKLHKQDHTIVFYTSRDDSCKTITIKWLKKYGFPFHHIEMKKFVAHVYIDDRAINGCNWKQVTKQLQQPDLPGVLARSRGCI